MSAQPRTRNGPDGRRGRAAGAREELAARLHLAVTRVARRLRQEADAELTPSQISALATVSRRGPLTLGELAEVERIAPPTVTRIIAKLEADGLVTRREDPDDRRVALVAASSAGERLLTRVRRRKVAWLVERLESLDASERERLADAVEILERLAEGP